MNGFSLDREWNVVLCVTASHQRLCEIDSIVKNDSYILFCVVGLYVNTVIVAYMSLTLHVMLFSMIVLQRTVITMIKFLCR